MNKWYSRFFRRLLNTTVLISVKNLGCKLDHLIFRTGFMRKLFHTVSNTGAVGDDNTVMQLTEQHIPRRIPPTENE
jgi:hypothetical protein